MQERTVYSCSEETNYECQVGKETRACTVEEKIEENVTEEVKTVEKEKINILLFIIVGIIISTVVGLSILFFFVLPKKCPYCGGKMRVEYSGKRLISYVCDKCEYKEMKSLKVKK
jgi:hypothetical protein